MTIDGKRLYIIPTCKKHNGVGVLDKLDDYQTGIAALESCFMKNQRNRELADTIMRFAAKNGDEERARKYRSILRQMMMLP